MKLLFALCFALGLGAIVIMGFSFLESNWLALTVTVTIALVFCGGFAELLRFHRRNRTLQGELQSLSEPVSDLDSWLAGLPSALQIPVRLRISGEPVALPLPVVSPYLVGLLVMLGLLGTFVGMVDTLEGAVAALKGTTELEAIRAGLAKPIGGLGIAFGTSVAGVAASAMLGLMLTLCKRERGQLVRQLDAATQAFFRSHNSRIQQQEAWQALQAQAAALPQVAESLTALSDKLGNMGESVSSSLLHNQESMQDASLQAIETLCQRVQNSLQESSRLSAEALQSQSAAALKDWLAEGRAEAQSLHTQLLENADASAQNTQATLQKTVDKLSGEIEAGLRDSREYSSEAVSKVLASGEALLDARIKSEAEWVDAFTQRTEHISATLLGDFERLHAQEKERSAAFKDALESMQAQLAQRFEQLEQGLNSRFTELIESSAAAPLAMQSLSGQLQKQLESNETRQQQLDESQRESLSQLQNLASEVSHGFKSSVDQVESLGQSALETVNELGDQYRDHAAAQQKILQESVMQWSEATIDWTANSEVFAAAVQQFGETNAGIASHLQAIDAALQASSERSDTQLAYYISQARELIDHSVLSQQDLIEQIRRLGQEQVQRAEAV